MTFFPFFINYRRNWVKMFHKVLSETIWIRRLISRNFSFQTFIKNNFFHQFVAFCLTVIYPPWFLTFFSHFSIKTFHFVKSKKKFGSNDVNKKKIAKSLNFLSFVSKQSKRKQISCSGRFFFLLFFFSLCQKYP